MTTIEPTIETTVAEEFAERLVGVFNDSSLALLLSIGHQVGLFDVLDGRPASTSAEIATAAGLNERYVRECLNGLTRREGTGCRPSTR